MSRPDVVIIIPARYASTRYPGKPLARLTGASGKSLSLIERSFRAASQVRGVDAVYVATDDARIGDEAERIGADVVMTSEECRNGTERCADAIAKLAISPRVVVNLQGDAPLTPAWFVENLVEAMKPGVEVATPVLRCSAEIHQRFVDDRRAGLVAGTTAVFDNNGRALYFSKEVLPFTGHTYNGSDRVPVFHHVGVYAYTTAALARYLAVGISELEQLEGLEQLRFLVNGVPIRCVEVDGRGREFWELNNPEDIPRIEQVLLREGIE